MSLVNADDEHILRELVVNYLFNPLKGLAGVVLDGSSALVLTTFFLGYCKSDEQVTRASQIQFQKKVLAARDFFVPLLDDWFIRPLYFLESLDDSAL